MEPLLCFGDALAAARNGHRIQRDGWNGKGQWVCFMPDVTIPDGMVNGRTKKFVPTGDLRVGGYFVIFNAQGVWQPGWLASQGDLQAEDWRVLGD